MSPNSEKHEGTEVADSGMHAGREVKSDKYEEFLIDEALAEGEYRLGGDKEKIMLLREALSPKTSVERIRSWGPEKLSGLFVFPDYENIGLMEIYFYGIPKFEQGIRLVDLFGSKMTDVSVVPYDLFRNKYVEEDTKMGKRAGKKGVEAYWDSAGRSLSIQSHDKVFFNNAGLEKERAPIRFDREKFSSKDILNYYKNWSKYLDYASERYGVPKSLIFAVISLESNFDPSAVNEKSGATGLGQFKEEAWKDFLSLNKDMSWYMNLSSEWRDKTEMEWRKNPELMINAIAWFLKNHASNIGIKREQMVERADDIYLAHHEGLSGYRAFKKFERIRREKPDASFEDLAIESQLYPYQKRGFEGHDAIWNYAKRVKRWTENYEKQFLE